MTTTKRTTKKAAPKRTPKPKPATPPASTEPEPLPGLEDTGARKVPYLEVGVRRTIAALREAGHLEEMHAAHTAAAVELAQIIDKKKASGRMSTIGNDMRAMIELLDRIVPEDSTVDAALAAAIEEWSEEVSPT